MALSVLCEPTAAHLLIVNQMLTLTALGFNPVLTLTKVYV